MRVKPPSSVLRSSSIRHENQENTFLPFFLHNCVATGPTPALRTYSAILTGTFSTLESEPRLWRIEPRGICRTWRWLDRFSERSDHQGDTHRPLIRICYWRIPEKLTSEGEA
jgi:hypothetical protein